MRVISKKKKIIKSDFFMDREKIKYGEAAYLNMTKQIAFVHHI